MKNLLLLSSVYARWTAGTCPSNDELTMQADLDLEAYGGVWYEMQRDAWTLYEIFGECC